MRIEITPFTTQKPGTGGLRRPTREFILPHYAESFVQAVINRFKALGMPIEKMAFGSDGRWPGKEMLPRLIKVLLANGVKKILVAGRDFVATTPAVSHLIRHHKCDGGFMLSASHNPGGIDGDFGIKVEMPNGGQPAESFTNALYEETKKLTSYETLEISDEEALFKAETIDAKEEYLDLMRSMFDFPVIHKWFDEGRTLRFDCMNASTGPYAHRIFAEEFGAKPEWILRDIPLGDFGGIHPEPNPTYARELYDFMMNTRGADFACACDGDGDRNMVMGKGIFVSPPDALAIMTKYYKLIPYYRDHLTGIARSIPTSSAVDMVAKKLGLKSYATPTGWKWFASLLDAGMVQLCGEESFGQGGDYIREKDGIFAILYWINIMGATGKGPYELLHELWNEYGRVFYSQYSYEGVDKDKAEAVVKYAREADLIGSYGIVSQESINYRDPATGEVSRNQGIQLVTGDGSRIFMRLSGTGTVGATLRLYIEKHEKHAYKFDMPTCEYLAPLRENTARIFRIGKYFGDLQPVVAI
ncbi:MAG: alpha-D-glucose phosphate-specific phosphoglucomutase [Rickettsiales bacterium]|jgi:phosphoglucomutase|nr:alpha-D-glucose phosphate-specific phosphoglucomutase [Rickettsiales bacterium]